MTGVTGQGGLFLLVGVPSQRFPVEGLLIMGFSSSFIRMQYPRSKESTLTIYVHLAWIKTGLVLCGLLYLVSFYFCYIDVNVSCFQQFIHTGMQSLMSKHSVFEVYLHLPCI